MGVFRGGKRQWTMGWGELVLGTCVVCFQLRGKAAFLRPSSVGEKYWRYGFDKVTFCSRKTDVSRGYRQRDYAVLPPRTVFASLNSTTGLNERTRFNDLFAMITQPRSRLKS
jgi:hypothetical protein